jgi:BMFP domain-containing protein YqiC
MHTKMRPILRTDFLSQRIGALEVENQQFQAQVAASQAELNDIQTQQLVIEGQITHQQETLVQSETQYKEKSRPERPYSVLAKTRQKVEMWQGRLERLEKKRVKQEKRLKFDQ